MLTPQHIGASILLASTLLYSQDLSTVGFWNGGSEEVYAEGNEHYCFKPDDGSSALFELNVNKSYFKSCIYITYGSVVAQSNCEKDPSLNVSNLSNKLYKVIVAPKKKANNVKYRLDVSNFSGAFGRCTDYYEAGYLGMKKEDINLVLALSGMFTAILFFGSITYVILTLGNF